MGSHTLKLTNLLLLKMRLRLIQERENVREKVDHELAGLSVVGWMCDDEGVQG